jgi:hypothetical protein
MPSNLTQSSAKMGQEAVRLVGVEGERKSSEPSKASQTGENDLISMKCYQVMVKFLCTYSSQQVPAGNKISTCTEYISPTYVFRESSHITWASEASQ